MPWVSLYQLSQESVEEVRRSGWRRARETFTKLKDITTALQARSRQHVRSFLWSHGAAHYNGRKMQAHRIVFVWRRPDRRPVLALGPQMQESASQQGNRIALSRCHRGNNIFFWRCKDASQFVQFRFGQLVRSPFHETQGAEKIFLFPPIRFPTKFLEVMQCPIESSQNLRLEFGGDAHGPPQLFSGEDTPPLTDKEAARRSGA